MERIYFQCKDKNIELCKIAEKHNCKESKNNFIKISMKTIFEDKLDDCEYTLHPTKTQKNVKTKSYVKLDDGHTPPRYNPSYTTIHEDIGFDNFEGEILLIYQVQYQQGITTKPPLTEIGDRVLSLDIESDEPFWMGFLFSKKNTKEIANILQENTINEYSIVECEVGCIIVAVRYLEPEWVKYKLTKDKNSMGHYTEHENFFFNTK